MHKAERRLDGACSPREAGTVVRCARSLIDAPMFPSPSPPEDPRLLLRARYAAGSPQSSGADLEDLRCLWCPGPDDGEFGSSGTASPARPTTSRRVAVAAAPTGPSGAPASCRAHGPARGSPPCGRWPETPPRAEPATTSAP